MILSKEEILRLIRKKEIIINPLSLSQLGPASVDLTLGISFRVFRREKSGKTKNGCYGKDTKSIIVIDENTDYRKHSVLVRKSSVIIPPGGLVLGITKEKIKLPSNICGWLQGRSRFARLGFSVHITASFVQPGVNNRQVLEMRNDNPAPLEVFSGTRVCQLVLEQLKGRSSYSGRFKEQSL